MNVRVCMRTLCLIILIGTSISAQQESWAEKTLHTLTLKEKIGQLIVVSTQAHRELDGLFYWSPEYEQLLQEYGIGGLLFLYKNDPLSQIQTINALNARSKIPLLITLDAEWGIAMRHEGVQHVPYALTLGAITDLALLEKAGAFLAEQCALLGVHFNLTPVVDIYSNKKNPVVNKRCFGSDVNRVNTHAAALIKGMQAAGMYGSAKHFPGHGNTDLDSHYTLPKISDSLEVFESTTLQPFKAAIEAGVKSIIVAHLLVPAFDAKNPASLSPAIYDYIRSTLHFDGLLMTDGLAMKALITWTESDVGLAALQAGADILLRPPTPYATACAIEQEVLAGRLSMAELDEHVLRVLRIKEELGIQSALPLPLENTEKVIELCNESDLIQELYDAAVTVVRDPQQLLLNENVKPIVVEVVAERWGESPFYGACGAEIEQINQLVIEKKPVVVVVYGNPYLIEQLPSHVTVIVAYENVPAARNAVQKVLSGQLQARGRLPI